MGPLLERENELRELRAGVAAAAGGRGSVVAIEGPAGAGKTRLLESARELAGENGLACLASRGGRLERAFGFGIVHQLFERHVALLAPEERARALDGAARLAAALVDPGGGTGDPMPGSAPDPEFAALHGLYWLVANLASRTPLVMTVDDAQWADPPSLRFLAYLARRIAELPALLVIAIRTGDPGAPHDLVAEVTAEAPRLVLAPLTESGTAELVRSSLGAPAATEFVAACHGRSGGNPFLLRALLDSLRQRGVEPRADAAALVGEAGVEQVSRAVAERLGALAPAAAELAEAVAVLGNDAERRHAAAVAGLPLEEAAAAADALSAAGILASTPALEFIHPLVRTAVFDAIPRGRRAGHHARAARVLETAGADAQSVALHVLASEPGAVASGAHLLERAAASALQRGAAEAAGRYLARALREPVDGTARARLLHRLGAIELRQGNPVALDHLREALEMTPAGPPRADVARELSLGLVPGGAYVEAIAILERAVAELEDADRELALLIEAEIGTEAMLSTTTLPMAVERLLPLRESVAAGGTPAELAVLATISILEAAGESDVERVTGDALKAFEGGLIEHLGPDSHVVYNVPFPLVLADRFDEASAVLDAALAGSRRRGSLLGVARGSAFRAQLALRRGALADAEADARASIEAAAPLWIVRQMSTGWLLEVLVERGELEGARRELEGAALDGELQDILMHNFALVSRARLRLALGEAGAAVEDLCELDRRESRGRARNPAWFGHRGLLAEALVALGDLPAARELAAEEVRLARRWGAPRALGVALRAAGLAAESADRLGVFTEAVDVLIRSPARLELARAQIELGSELRRQGRRRACRAPLTEGMEIAHRCGAAPLAERAREELLASGARPRRMVSSGVDALTVSELRVARMAATGMSNRDIAQALFVTMRTVEVHLTHTYQKLDISSRADLPAALAA